MKSESPKKGYLEQGGQLHLIVMAFASGLLAGGFLVGAALVIFGK